MARSVNRLTARGVVGIVDPGYHADGAGLYLQVSGTGSKSWIFRFARHGRAREMGLGPLHTTSLAAARSQAEVCRRGLRDGVDPIDARQAAVEAARLAAARTVTFSSCALAYIDAHRTGWRNAKHVDQWRNTLRTYAFPVFGDRPVQDVDTALVMGAIQPLWTAKTETANRVRGRIEAVLDWATVRGFRRGDNPARWRGHLDHLLPDRSKVQRVVHHAALPYMEMSSFMAALREQDGVGARGLEFQILTAGRTGEVIGARWAEFDEENRTWTVPADRMKARREHRVALSSMALRILGGMRAVSQSEFVFPGLRASRPLSNMAFLQLLKRMGRHDITAHGFRSAFRDWAAERTTYAPEVVEMALAHTINDKVEAAYRRGDLLEKRHQLMEEWARHCDPASSGETERARTDPSRGA